MENRSIAPGKVAQTWGLFSVRIAQRLCWRLQKPHKHPRPHSGILLAKNYIFLALSILLLGNIFWVQGRLLFSVSLLLRCSVLLGSLILIILSKVSASIFHDVLLLVMVCSILVVSISPHFACIFCRIIPYLIYQKICVLICILVHSKYRSYRQSLLSFW